MRLVVNSVLTLVLMSVLMLPVTANHFVVLDPSGFGTVAGVASIDETEVNIIPNLKDFSDHVIFDPQPIKDGAYSDSVQLRVFQRQKASYKGLYTIYNLSESRTYAFEIITAGTTQETMAVEDAYNSIRIIPAEEDYQNELLQNVSRGDTLITVSNLELLTRDEPIIIGEEVVEVVEITSDGAVVTPLQYDHTTNERVYPESILVKPNRVINPTTQVVTLQPGEKLSVDAVVEGTANLLISDELVPLPIVIRISEVL